MSDVRSPTPHPLYPAEVLYDPETENRSDVEVGYLLDETFMCFKQPNRGLLLTGWDVDAGGGGIADSLRLILFKESGDSPVRVSHRLIRQQNSVVTVDFTVTVESQTLTDCTLFFGEESALAFGVRVGWDWVELFTRDGTGQRVSFANGPRCSMRLVADGKKGLLTLWVNGHGCSSLVYTQTPFDRATISTGSVGEGLIRVGALKVHKGYAVLDDFVCGALSDQWEIRGDPGAATVEEVISEYNCGPYSLRLQAGGLLNRRTDRLLNGSWQFACSLFTDDPAAALGVYLHNEDHLAAGVYMRDTGLYLQSGDRPSTRVYDYVPRVWFHLRMEYADQLLTLYVNYKKAATIFTEKLSIDGLCLWCDCGEGLLDDVMLAPLPPLPSDYVPQPCPVRPQKDMEIGMLRCDLWHASDHLGWDRINGFDDNRRMPLMGWYEDGSPEAADWETRFMVEHGITFQMNCWYRPYGTVGKPIKTPLHSYALHEGYFRSQYSDLLRFTLFITITPGEIAGLQDFQENIVPYLIEYYIKDSRFLVIDNKPVIAFSSMEVLRDDLGGNDQCRQGLAYLSDRCRALGYDGATFITCTGAMQTQENCRTNQIAREVGCAYACAYGWGLLLAESGSGQLAAIRDTRDYEGVDNLITSMTVGFDSYPWLATNSCECISVEDFRSLAKALRDEHLPSYPEGSFLSRVLMVDNWNEFSEGHFINPTGICGFGYLDVIREVFTQAGTHEDVIPTRVQRERIGRLYPQNRRLIHPSRYPDIPSVQACSCITELDMGRLQIVPIIHDGRCGDVHVQEGGIVVAPADRNMLFFELNGMEIPTKQALYIRITLQGDTSGFDGKLYFKTNGDEVNWLYNGRALRLLCKENEHTCYLADIGRATAETGFYDGILTGLLLCFFSLGEKVVIEKIEFLGI